MPNDNPFARINQYCSPDSTGGMHIDTEAMVTDLITVFKMGHLSEEDLHEAIISTWPQITVEMEIPTGSKN